MNYDDALDILGLQKPVDMKQIKAAYRKMAAQHHPDKGGNAMVFQMVKEAYDLLKSFKNVVTHSISLQEAYTGGYIAGVQYPAGIRNKTRIKVDANSILNIHVEESPVYLRDGDDLLMQFELSAIDAILGSEVTFKHLDGVTYSATIKPGTQHDEVLTFPNLGMRNPELNKHGTLFIQMKLTVPTVDDGDLENMMRSSSLYSPKIKLDTKL